MAISPLDIYDRAYRLQYEKNDIPAAVELYKRIMGEFPDSNECGYSAVQLEKIQAAGILEELENRVEAKTGNTLALVALVVAILAFLAAAGLGTFIVLHRSQEAEINGALIRSLGFLGAGQDEDALGVLRAMQRKYPANSDMRALIAIVDNHRVQSASTPEPPPVPAVSEEVPETLQTEPVAPPPPPAVKAPVKAPPLLSEQQKALGRQLAAKPVRKPTRTEPSGVRPLKSSADDSISFFP